MTVIVNVTILYFITLIWHVANSISSDYPLHNATDGYDYDSDYNYTYDYKGDDYFENFMKDLLGNNAGKRNFFDLDGDDCMRFYTCNSSSSYRTCYCDAMCYAYKDCCFDAKHPIGSVQGTEKQKDLIDHMSCKALQEVKTDWYMFIIDSCPNESNVYLKNLCTNISGDDIYSKAPATGKESGMVYRNMFCAMCHDENFTLWFPQIDCEWELQYVGSYETEELLRLDECRLSFVPNDSSVEIRNCNPMVSTCFNESDTALTNNSFNQCESTKTKTVFTSDKVYKNKHCYECDLEKAGNASCSRVDHNASFPGGSRGLFMYSYKILFSLEDRKAKSTKDHLFFPSETKEYHLESNCTIAQMFDPFAKSCKTTLCAVNKVIKDGKCVSRQTISSQKKRKMCQTIILNETDYVQHNETSITLLRSNETYHNVRIENKTAFVCTKIKNSVGEGITIGIYLENILSFACSATSVLFLILTIFVYSIRRIMNIAGRILVCLALSLCIAQLLFIFASLAENIPTLCTIIAVCTHYFYLSSFTWMNILSFDVHKKIATQFYSSKDGMKRFKFFSLYAWMIPLAIVSSGFILDKMTSTSWRPAYGTNVCWISNSNGLIAFFLIPVAALVFTNILLYLRTSWVIFMVKRNSAKILNKRDKCEILIYVRLSIVMGLTWVFAYVAIIAEDDVLWYLFIILNGSQGLLIFCSFILKKNFPVIACEKINSKRKTCENSNVYCSKL